MIEKFHPRRVVKWVKRHLARAGGPSRTPEIQPPQSLNVNTGPAQPGPACDLHEQTPNDGNTVSKLQNASPLPAIRKGEITIPILSSPTNVESLVSANCGPSLDQHIVEHNLGGGRVTKHAQSIYEDEYLLRYLDI